MKHVTFEEQVLRSMEQAELLARQIEKELIVNKPKNLKGTSNSGRNRKGKS